MKTAEAVAVAAAATRSNTRSCCRSANKCIWPEQSSGSSSISIQMLPMGNVAACQKRAHEKMLLSVWLLGALCVAVVAAAIVAAVVVLLLPTIVVGFFSFRRENMCAACCCCCCVVVAAVLSVVRSV